MDDLKQRLPDRVYAWTWPDSVLPEIRRGKEGLWSASNDGETEYIRADLAAAALDAKDAEIARWRALLDDLTGEAENDTDSPYFKAALYNARAALTAGRGD